MLEVNPLSVPSRLWPSQTQPTRHELQETCEHVHVPDVTQPDSQSLQLWLHCICTSLPDTDTSNRSSVPLSNALTPR